MNQVYNQSFPTRQSGLPLRLMLTIVIWRQRFVAAGLAWPGPVCRVEVIIHPVSKTSRHLSIRATDSNWSLCSFN
jgi:hypothetical protein